MRLFLICIIIFGLFGCCVTLPENTYERPKTFVPIKKEQIFQTHIGKKVEMACPICGECYPIGGEYGWTTLMYCDGGCCNTTTYDFFCSKTGEHFSKQVNECNWIVWGKFK